MPFGWKAPLISTSRSTRSGRRTAAHSATTAPALYPASRTGPPMIFSTNAMVACAIASAVIGPGTSAVGPWPRRSGHQRPEPASHGIDIAGEVPAVREPALLHHQRITVTAFVL